MMKEENTLLCRWQGQLEEFQYFPLYQPGNHVDGFSQLPEYVHLIEPGQAALQELYGLT